jgi:hypothetical protein
MLLVSLCLFRLSARTYELGDSALLEESEVFEVVRSRQFFRSFCCCIVLEDLRRIVSCVTAIWAVKVRSHQDISSSRPTLRLCS